MKGAQGSQNRHSEGDRVRKSRNNTTDTGVRSVQKQQRDMQK